MTRICCATRELPSAVQCRLCQFSGHDKHWSGRNLHELNRLGGQNTTQGLISSFDVFVESQSDPFRHISELVCRYFLEVCLLEMQRQVPTSCDSSLRIAERHIAFPIHPFDPPSSPPPTSPLPPLPVIAPYNHGSSVSTLSPIHPAFTTGRPVRPPRPQTSLPDLKPRTITSPDIPQRQRHSTVLAQSSCSPTSPSRRWRIPQSEGQSPGAAGQFEPNQLLGPTPRTAFKFSDDVLGALPKLFNRISPLQPVCGEPAQCAERTGGANLWQHHGRSTQGSSRARNRKNASRKPVARSALFIPRTPPRKRPHVNTSGKSTESSLGAANSCYDAQNIQSEVLPSFQCSHTTQACHKRSQAVTSFAFGFGNSQTSVLSSASSENLTSLPRIPSDPVVVVNTVVGGKDAARSLSKLSDRRYSSSEAITFATLPYAHTLHTAGPRPKTEKDTRVRFDTERDIEAGGEEARQMTEEEIQAEKRKRIIWAIATVTLVIVATAGILIGIIWKLRSLT